MGGFLSDNLTNFGDEDDPDSPVSSSKSTPPPPSSTKVSPPPPSTPPRSTPPPPKETNSPPPPSKPNPPKDTNTPPKESDIPPEDIDTPPKDNNPPPNPPPKENDPPPKGSEALSPPPPRSTNPTPPEVTTPISAKPPPKASPSGGSRPEDQSSSSPSDSTPASHPKQLPSSSSSSSSTSKPSKDSSSSSSGIIIGLIIGGVLVILIAVCFVIIIRRRRRRLDALDYRPSTSFVFDDNYYRQTQQLGGSARSNYNLAQGHSGVMGGSNRYGYHSGQMDPNAHNGSKSWFSYEELVDITDGFCRENMIGEGGFGCVYKGTLLDGRRVAVKQLKAGSGQGEREFRAEVDIISRVHHRYLVSLVGYCIAEYHRLLVYEFLPNNTLEHHLHGKNTLDWSKRMRIAIGSAKGLAYLHEDCHPKIIHRDIKSANILLEDSFEPRVADFGLAKLSNDTNTHVSTRVMGTFGYMAPEYASSGKLTDRSDVFSFGVVLLEMITGRKPVDATRPIGDESLVEWARPLLLHALETGNCDELVDPRLQGNYNKIEMFTMIETAAACVRHSAPKRPRMVQVVRSLDCQDEMQDLTNGVKYGQSQAFNSDQYSADIQKFHRMAFDDGDSYEFDSVEYDRRTAASGELRKQHQQNSALKPAAANQHFGEYPSDESDTRAMFRSERSNGRGYS